jgi:hypothetical protein
MGYFRVPRNLPHAAVIVERLERRLQELQLYDQSDSEELYLQVELLQETLGKYAGKNEPPEEEAIAASTRAAQIGRKFVDEIERLGGGEDRIGQIVRNLFECLGLGEEGASLSLRAGENPNSLMRPSS